MHQTQVIRILQSAFAVWSDVSKLEFTQFSPSQDGDIQIEFLKGDHGDQFPFDGLGIYKITKYQIKYFLFYQLSI